MYRSQRLRAWAATASVLMATTGLGAQAPTTTARTGTLIVAGDVKSQLTLKPEDLRTMPRTAVNVQDEDGRTQKYEGVLIGELLKRGGAPLGSDLRGNAVSTYVIASAADGYQALFSLAELDPAFTGSQILIADTVDGKSLFDYQGPLRIVAPLDKRGARSVRMLERIEVHRLQK